MLLIFLLILSTYLTDGQRYVIDNDNDLGKYYAFAIDICFKANAYPNKYLKYSCSRTGQSLEKREYADRYCTQPQSVSAWKTDTLSPCNGPKFSCDGSDEYQMLSFYFSCSSYEIYIFPIAVGCYCDSNHTSYHTNCVNDDEVGHSSDLITYTNDITCSQYSNIDSEQYFDDCIAVGQSQGNNLNTVYAKIKSCNTTNATRIITTTATSESSSFDTVWIYVIIAVGIFCLFACLCVILFRYTGRQHKTKDEIAAAIREENKNNDLIKHNSVAPAAPAVAMAQPDINNINTVSIESYDQPGQMEGGFEGNMEGGGVKGEGGNQLPGQTNRQWKE